MKKKIVMVQHCGTVGGSGLGLLTTAKFLRDQFDVVVYCIASPDAMLKRYEEEGICAKPITVPLPVNGYYNGGPGLFTRSCLSAFHTYKAAVSPWKRIIEEEKADFLLVNSLVMSWMYHCTEGTGCKSICHVREVLRSTKTFCGKMILDDLEHFDAVWFISENERDKMKLKYPKTCIVRDSLLETLNKMDFSLQNQRKRDRFTVLYVGGASYLKGFPTLAKSLKYLDASICVNVAGYLNVSKPKALLGNFIYFTRFIDYYRLCACIKMVQKSPSVKMLGYITDMNSLYSSCDVLAFPSQKAHQARPAFEAGFFGKPVIISDFEDTGDNVRNGYNGVTFKPNSPRAFANAVNMLAKNPQKCAELGRNNREHALNMHTYESVQSDVQSFMKEFSAGEA